ncbi:MAG: hypothetical protein HQ581_08940 [Planctomycetes bacterium]|nr:hypothetical protein [Planctomycetota bacterium]
MHSAGPQFIEHVAAPLGCFYLVACALNIGAAAWDWRRSGDRVRAGAWLAVAAVFAVLGGLALGGVGVPMPEFFKAAVNAAMGPVTLTFGSLAALAVLYRWRRFFVRPVVAWAGLNLSLLWMGLSMTDPHFAAIVTKPDNVPIVAMVYLMAYFTWLATAMAVENDRRLAQGDGPVEKQYNARVLVWPDLVYIELICIVILSAVLIVWSVALPAPLEQPANPVVTPNPSKAPWYFLGLQEMLVFFPPWMAGVVLPGLIVLGLMAVPYLDPNKEGNGYYTIGQRRFGYVVFQFGFLQLWLLMILIGTFMRGPNWNFFGLYAPRDPHLVAAANNVKLSVLFWVMLLGRELPQAVPGAGTLAQLGAAVWREIAGIVAMGGYFVVLPVVLGRTVLADFVGQMGRTRYTIMILLLLMMLVLPIKMLLVWVCHLSYIVSMPEYFFNF